jgi:hypothetical protein
VRRSTTRRAGLIRKFRSAENRNAKKEDMQDEAAAPNISNTKEPNAESSPSSDGVVECVTATAKTRRKGYKIMSRRCQMGTEVIEGKMYRLRVRVDVPGEGRIQKSFPICPVSGQAA